MEQRRLTGWIALIVLLLGVAVFVYYDFRRNQDKAQAPIVTSAESPAAASTEPAPKESAYFPDAKTGVADASTEAPAAGAAPSAATATETAPASETAKAPDGSRRPAATGEAAPATPPATESAAAPEAATPPAPSEEPAAPPAPAAESAAAPVTEAPSAPAIESAAAPAAAPEASADASNAAPPAAPQTADAGPAPSSAQPEAAPAATPAAPAATTAAPEAPPAAPETEVALAEPPATGVEPAVPAPVPSEPAAAAPPAVIPSFDIVRVEPTGDTVIAGVAAPNATVELLDGDGAVATAMANERGEWALSLDKPLPPGPHDLAIRTTSADEATVTLSDQRVTVAVPEKPTEEPLVVLNTPDEASKVLQLPAKPAETKVAEAQPEAKPAEPAASESQAAAMPAEPNAASAPAETVAEPSSPPTPRERPAGMASAPSETEIAEAPKPSPGDSAETKVAAEPEAEPAAEAETTTRNGELGEPPKAEIQESEAEVAEKAKAQEPDAASADAQPAPAEPTAADVPASSSEPAKSAAPAAPEAPAATEVAREEPAEPQIVPEVAVTAVEADTAGAVFVAGTANNPDPVRVYLDGELLGEATPSPSGTWLLEVERELPTGTYAVRADQVDAGGAVMVRAEVPFEREIEVAVLTPVGGTGGPGGAAASGTMTSPQTLIIKRRDNLWRISRKLYGKGVRWSTIYEANRDQIKNPRWIYPGQVFVMPSGDTKWQEQ